MRIHSPQITGSAENTNIVTITRITSLSALSSSFASTASFVQNAQSASYVLNAVSASRAVSSSRADSATTSSYVLNAVSSSYAATASYADNFTVGGTLTAQTINVQIITSSIEFNTGSTRNGALSTNTHQFTGSVLMSGSLTVGGASTFSDKIGIGGTSSYTSFNIATGNDTQMALGTTTTAQTVGVFFADGPSTNTSNYKWEYGKGTANNFFIYSYGTAANALSIAYATGNVGIGTSSPTFKLEVTSSGDGLSVTTSNSSQALRLSSATNNNTLFRINNFNGNFYDIQNQPSDNSLVIDYNDAERIRITSGGQVGVATTTIASAFNMQVGNNSGVIATTILRLQDSYLSGTTGYYGAQITAVDNGVDGHNLLFQTRANATSVFSTRMTITTTGNIGAPSGTNIYNASDIRLKQNISTTTYGLNTISLLNPVKFNWKDGFEPTEDGKDMLGFVAQEVLEVIPEAVELFGGDINLNGETITTPLRVNEKFIIPVLVKAIQELKSENDTLKEILQRNNIQ
jgi:hypothetical protein